MAGKYTNNATTTLAGSISTSATSISVPAGTGDLFPVLGAGDWCYLTLVKLVGGLEVLEIVKATARAADVFTIVRAQEGTTARTFTGGDKVDLRITAAGMNEKAALDSPAFTGTPTAVTQAEADDTTKIATNAFANRAANTALAKVAGTTATVASAATTDIATPGVGNVSITGTTTITGLGTAPEGTLRHVIFAGALTLTYNVTSMQLPGLANILTAAGDSAIFKSLGGGNWKCLFYQRAADMAGSSGTIAVASAATTNIGAASSNNVNITGTTTITAFDTATEGSLRYATFAGILTLTHNATTLQLPGAANIVTAAGDTALLKSLGGGNWKCLMYQRASVVPLNYAPVNRTGDTITGDITFNNNVKINGKDSGGTARIIVSYGGDNNVNFVNGTGGNWRVYNSAGLAVILNLGNTGDLGISGNIVFDNVKGIQMKDGGGTVRTISYVGADNWLNTFNPGAGVRWFNTAANTTIMSLSDAGSLLAISVGQTSDEGYKWKWKKTQDDLIEQIAGIKRVGYFTWKGRHKKLGQSLGVGAQSLEPFMPGAVSTDEHGFKSVQYGPAAFVLGHALAREAVHSKKEIAKLKADVAKLSLLVKKLVGV